jgi:drug/metabolite transporter (DMT)-like permease
VVWSEQYVASGIASVLVASMPLWAAFFEAVVPGGKTPLTWRIGVGLAIGFLGSALLAGITPHELATADLRGPIALTLGSASWALGSVYWKRNPTAEVSPYAAAAAQMAVAGALLCVFGLAIGEAPRFHLDGTGLGAMAYLIIFGSIVGYTAYGYALEHASATIVGTYAYVNPVVAVLLGWLVLAEPITGRMLAAMALILGSVLWIQLAARPTRASSARPVRALERRREADAA